MQCLGVSQLSYCTCLFSSVFVVLCMKPWIIQIKILFWCCPQLSWLGRNSWLFLAFSHTLNHCILYRNGHNYQKLLSVSHCLEKNELTYVRVWRTSVTMADTYCSIVAYQHLLLFTCSVCDAAVMVHSCAQSRCIETVQSRSFAAATIDASLDDGGVITMMTVETALTKETVVCISCSSSCSSSSSSRPYGWCGVLC